MLLHRAHFTCHVVLDTSCLVSNRAFEGSLLRADVILHTILGSRHMLLQFVDSARETVGRMSSLVADMVLQIQTLFRNVLVDLSGFLDELLIEVGELFPDDQGVVRHWIRLSGHIERSR